MTFSATRFLILAAAVAAVPALAQPAAAQSDHAGSVSITIHKAPSYLNTRATPNGPTTAATRELSAVYQSSFAASPMIIGFQRSPLPSNLNNPGF